MLCCAVAGISGAEAMAVSWGSELFSDFRDSFGNSLDETFVVELGFFEDVLGTPFVPGADNVADWIARWKTFDQASLNLGMGYFSSEARVTEEGTSTSPAADLGVNFTGHQAYVWIRNATEPEQGTEWFLAAAPQWVFPQGSDECCDTSLPLQWSISDLNPDGGEAVTPVWGSQSGNTGSGVYETTAPEYTLQTFTFAPPVSVPEPTAILLTLSGSLLLFRRQRPIV
jgi:hypothetical protein